MLQACTSAQRQGSNSRRRSDCCWHCSLVLVLLWSGYTHANKTCAFGLVIEKGALRDTAGCAGPDFPPSHSYRAQASRNATTSSQILQRGYTTMVLGRPARDQLSERPSCKH